MILLESAQVPICHFGSAAPEVLSTLKQSAGHYINNTAGDSPPSAIMFSLLACWRDGPSILMVTWRLKGRFCYSAGPSI